MQLVLYLVLVHIISALAFAPFLINLFIVLQALCLELEAKFYEGTFNWNTVKQHDAASLLKFFIRELPLPLLTVEYMKAFHSVQCEMMFN